MSSHLNKLVKFVWFVALFACDRKWWEMYGMVQHRVDRLISNSSQALVPTSQGHFHKSSIKIRNQSIPIGDRRIEKNDPSKKNIHTHWTTFKSHTHTHTNLSTINVVENRQNIPIISLHIGNTEKRQQNYNGSNIYIERTAIKTVSNILRRRQNNESSTSSFGLSFTRAHTHTQNRSVDK